MNKGHRWDCNVCFLSSFSLIINSILEKLYEETLGYASVFRFENLFLINVDILLKVVRTGVVQRANAGECFLRWISATLDVGFYLKPLTHH